MSLAAFLAAVESTQYFTAALSMLAAVFAGIAALGSYRLARQIRDELASDERVVAGQLHHPTLADPRHSPTVIQTTLFNKSKRKAVITSVLLKDSKGKALDVDWSDEIDVYGNPQGGAMLFGIVDSKQVYIRKRDGTAIVAAVVEIYHSFANSPLRVPFEMEAGWDRWAVE